MFINSNNFLFYFLDFRWLLTLKPIIAGAAMYIPKFNAMTEIPNPNTDDSEPSSASVMIDRVDNIGGDVAK